MRSTPLSLFAAVLALVFAGCGSDDSNTTANTTSTSSGARGYAETGKTLDQICADLKKKGTPLANQLNGNAEHDAPILRKIVDISQGSLDEIQNVEPNGKLKDAFDKYVDVVGKNVDQFRKLADAAASGDQQAYDQARKDLGDQSLSTQPLERALGATGCANG
jgi:hypothetical protein